jgi:hypothetical protein
MTTTDFRLIAILRIAQQVSGGEGATSIEDALVHAGYAAYRPSFDAADVRALLEAHPSLLEQWLAYSEDKRTDKGWYVLRDGEIGQVTKPTAQRSYATIDEAVAQFVVRELDFWAGLAS